MKLGIFVSMMSVGLAAFANLSITEVKAVQRYPWNGKVDISYKASGIESAAKKGGWNTSLKVTATDKQSGTTYTATSLTGDASVSDGTHAAVWDMSAQGLTFKSTNVVFDVTCVVDYGGVQLWENGPYWAECNVGATKPEECGYYFWWGDAVGYKRNANNSGWVSVKDGSGFSFSNCPTIGKSNSQLQSAGYIDASGNLVAAHDAATAHRGAPWRMPTDAEFSALINNCDTQWTSRGGVYGRLVMGRGAYASKSKITRLDGQDDWKPVTHTFTADGDHTITWTYVKDDTESAGEDCVWMDAFVWTPAPADPIPEIPSSATAADIAKALEGSKDPGLTNNITTVANYNAYRAWAQSVTLAGDGLAGKQAVKDSPLAWLSFALDSAVLLTKAPEQGEMKIAAFEKNATTGKFDFAVEIEGVNARPGATAENLAKVFGMEGSTAVDGVYSADNVVFTFGTPVGGKVVVSALPADETATQFFMKVKML